jgi:trehalose 2-sulfotransferase
MSTNQPVPTFKSQPLPGRGYLICCMPRTGSVMLAQALRSTGLAGQPTEWFNPLLLDKPPLRDILGGLSLVEGLDRVFRAGTSANGIFGAVMHWGHPRFLGAELSRSPGDGKLRWMSEVLSAQLPRLLNEEQVNSLLEEEFGQLEFHTRALEFLQSKMPDLRLIWLDRREMLARAVSQYRAEASGEWFRRAGHAAPCGGRAPDFDLGRIHTVYQLGLYQQRSWKRFFQMHGIEPHRVMYEDLVDRYEETVRGVLGFLDLEAQEAKIGPPATARQADELSRDWMHRYLKLIEASEAGSGV